MEADLKSRMDQDLTQKLDTLFELKMQPALHLSQRFDDFINRIDYDSERLQLANESADSGSSDASETPASTSKVNEVRCEFIRILKLLEQSLQTKLLANETQELGEDFELLQKRVEDFRCTPFSPVDDINDFEDSYGHLVVEIRELTNAEERKIFGNQTIVYLSSKRFSKLGCLIHLTDVFLTNEQIEYLRAIDDSDEDPRMENIHANTEMQFNRSLVVSVKLPYIVNKSTLVTYSLYELSNDIKNNQVVQFDSSDDDQLGYSVDTTKVGKASLERDLISEELAERHIEGFSYHIEEYDEKRLFLSGNRLKNLDTRLVSGFELLTCLHLSDNELESLDEDLLASCKSLRLLNLENACHPDAVFSLKFLEAIAENLEELSLILPVGPLNFEVFSKMNSLEKLTVHGASSLDSNRRPQKLTSQELAQVNTKSLTSLSLSHFDLQTIGTEILQSFELLHKLSLASCNINRIDPDVFKERCPLLEELDLSCNRLDLSCNMFAGLNMLIKLDLGYNEIRTLSSRCFQGLYELRVLDLRSNRIQDLPPALFDDLAKLVELNLACNKLTSVSRAYFQNLKSLTHLTLDHNLIEAIEADAFLVCENLNSISMSHCQLKSIHSHMFTGMAHSLISLYLDHNLIDSFQIKTGDDGDLIDMNGRANLTPREIEKVKECLFAGCRRLYRIELQGNLFTKLDLRVFCHLQRLHHLDLSSNQLNELNSETSEGFFDPFLELNLSENQLTKISETSFPEVDHLRLENNPITSFQVESPIDVTGSNVAHAMIESMFSSQIKPTVGDLERIAHLSIAGQKFLFSNSQPQAFQNLLKNREFDDEDQDIEELLVINCLLRSEDAPEILTRFPSLTQLELCWNLLDRFEAGWIQSMDNLQILSLRGNAIETLDDANLFTNCSNILSLEMSHNRLRSINRRLFHGLYKLLQLDLSRNPQLSSMDDGLFRSQSSMVSINMSGNNIKQLNLSRLFRSCRYLTYLNLSNNQLDNRTFSRENMGPLVNLQALFLNDNKLEDIEFVRDMSQLKMLELKNNRIESIEIDDCNLLGRLRSLEHLDLSGNRIQRLSKDLFAHLERQLIKLDVSGNLFESEPALGLRLFDYEKSKRRQTE